jgi:hypothetical protein
LHVSPLREVNTTVIASSSSVSPAAIAVPIVCGVVLVGVLVALYFCRKRKRNKQSYDVQVASERHTNNNVHVGGSDRVDSYTKKMSLTNTTSPTKDDSVANDGVDGNNEDEYKYEEETTSDAKSTSHAENDDDDDEQAAADTSIPRQSITSSTTTTPSEPPIKNRLEETDSSSSSSEPISPHQIVIQELKQRMQHEQQKATVTGSRYDSAAAATAAQYEIDDTDNVLPPRSNAFKHV